MMDSITALLYGAVQGLTEYLPVSSSAHLALLPHALGTPDPGLAFDVMLHFGTLLATLIYFFKEWLVILKNPLPKKSLSSLSWVHLIVGTIPAGMAGVLLNHWIEDHTRAPWIMGVTLPVFGVLLFLADRYAGQKKGMKDASMMDMWVIGCFQMLALIPGVSRSGSTITAARMRGFNRQESARVSFLLSMPVILGAVVLEFRHWDRLAASLSGWEPLVLGMLAALVSGGLAIHYLIRLLGKASYTGFAIYRIALGLFILNYFRWKIKVFIFIW